MATSGTLRVGNTSGKWNESMEEVHNESLLPRNQAINKKDYIEWLNSVNLLEGTKKTLREIFFDPHRLFDSVGFRSKFDVSKKCVVGVYYRKMSGGERAAIDGKPNPFDKVFEYTQTDNYRYWISSSLAKVKAFGNENSSDSDAHIIRMEFNVDLRKPPGVTVSAHQEPGVQGNKNVIAIHREGFAELGIISTPEQVTEILDKKLDHNLGFTKTLVGTLRDNLKSWKFIT